MFGRRPKTRAAKPREKTFRAGHFLRRPKSETAHEKPLAPRVMIIPLSDRYSSSNFAVLAVEDSPRFRHPREELSFRRANGSVKRIS